MELYSTFKPFSPSTEKEPFSLIQLPRNDMTSSKNPSFLRQSTNSMENFSLMHPSKEFNPNISDKTSSIPELKDLNQERALSRIKSRASSNSKSPKNNFSFNNANNTATYIKDLEHQWKNMKEDHRNFLSQNEKKKSFILTNGEKEETYNKKEDNSMSPSRLVTFNQNFEENSKEDNKFYQVSEKKGSLLTPNKFLKKSVPHSKINLDFCKKMLISNPLTNSARNTPDRSKDKLIEKREFSPCINYSSNHQNNSKDSQQHFKMILNKYANIYKKNIEIDLTNLNNNKSNSMKIKNISNKICSEDDKKSLNNSKVSTNTGKSENTKRTVGLHENRLKITASQNSQNSIKNIEYEKNNNACNDKINEKLRKINTTKIYLKEDDISMDIPSENKDLDAVKKQITRSPNYFNKKQSFGSSHLNSGNLSFKNEKSQKITNELPKKSIPFQKERDSLKNDSINKAEKNSLMNYTPKKEGSNNNRSITIEKFNKKEITPKMNMKTESSIDQNLMDYSEKRSKNNKNITTFSEKENFDLAKMSLKYSNNSNNFFEQNLLNNKAIIEGLYRNCIDEKPNDLQNNSNSFKNCTPLQRFGEIESTKKLNLTLDESKYSSFAFSLPNGESIIGFPFVENNEKISYSMKNFNKPIENNYRPDDNKIMKTPNNSEKKNFEIPTKSQDLVFSFNNSEKGFSLLSEKMNTEKYFNLK